MLVSGRSEELQKLADSLADLIPVKHTWATSSAQALALAKKDKFQLVVIGQELEGGPLSLAAELIKVDAFANLAVVSDEPEDEFHERSEGLGIMSQLPSQPGPQEAGDLLQSLKAMGLSF